MKCTACGYNLNIEDEFCPHCGKVNEFASKHTDDMKKFSKEFETTKIEVMGNSNFVNSFAAKLTVIGFLLALIALCIIGRLNSYEIVDMRWQRKIAENSATTISKLQAFEDEKDFAGMNYYFQKHRLYYAKTEGIREFEASNRASNYYSFIEKNMHSVINTKCERYSSYDSPENSIKEITQYMDRMKEIEDGYRYNPEALEGSHREYIDAMKEEISDMIMVYFDLSEEQRDEIWDMSSAKLTVLMEEGYKEIYGGEENE